jgi:hypothetical protein
VSSKGHRPQTVARSGAVPVSGLTERNKVARAAAAGQHGVLAAPSAASVRKFIEAQVCPWCGTGPWQVMAGHTSKAHGISAAELREMAGLIKAASICSPDHSKVTSERSRRRWDSAESSPLAAFSGGKGRKRSFSTAGRVAQREKALAQTAEQRQRRSENMRAARAAAGQPKHEEILQLYDQGLLLAEIAVQADVSPITARRVIRAHRDNPDLLKRAFQSARWQAGAGRGRRKGHETRSRRTQAEREAIRAEFENAGATRQALHALAVAHGITVKSMRGKLKRAGAALPDGRIARSERLS